MIPLNQWLLTEGKSKGGGISSPLTGRDALLVRPHQAGISHRNIKGKGLMN